MIKINSTGMLAGTLALALWFFSSHLYAQTGTEPNSTNNFEAAGQRALPQPASQGTGAVRTPPNKKGLKGIAAYADGRTDLTPDQIKIGFNIQPQVGDRAQAMALIKKTYDSVDFLIWKDNTATPLGLAAARGDAEMVAAILAKGIAVDSAKSNDWQKGQTALINALISAFQTYPSATPPERTLETVRLLLKAGANPNAKENYGRTPLTLAFSLRPSDSSGDKIKVAIVKALLDSGADPGTVLMPSVTGRESDDEITKLLLDHGLDSKAQGSTALAEAVQNRRTDLVKLLLAKGANPNARALGRSGPVIANADMDIAKMLLAAGANPNACNEEDTQGKCKNQGQPLMFWATMDPEFFRMAIAKGANSNAEDAQGQTALGNAISHRSYQQQGITMFCIGGTTNCMKPPEDKFDRLAAAKMLLDAGADPNKRSRGQQPLMMVEDSDHEMITLLLDKGARLESISVEGEQIGPISQALAARREFLSGELLRRTRGKLRADEKWALYAAASDGKLKLAEALVQHGIKPDERGPLGETALHYAAHTGNAIMVKRLLALGANPNVQTDAIPHVAASSSNPAALWIAQIQANESHMQAKQKIYAAVRQNPPNIGDGKVTPLMLAVVSGDVEVAKALLDGGARISTKSQQGLSALDIAHRMDNQDMERLLAGH